MELTDKLFLLIDSEVEIQNIFPSLWTYIKFLFEYSYISPEFISKLLSLSRLDDIKNYLAPFFINNFYENILSSQSLDNNLIYIIYRLLKEEIDSIPDYNSSEKFLNNTRCGYLLEQMIEKIDIRSFCKLIILKVVEDLEWTFSGKKLCLDVKIIIQNLVRQRQRLEKEQNDNKKNKISKNQIKKSYTIFSACEVTNENNNDNINGSVNRMNSTLSSFDGFGDKELAKSKKNIKDSEEFNSKYILDIDLKQYENENVPIIKEFIKCQIEINKNNWSLYSNEVFINNIYKAEKSEETLSIYIISFMKIKESINLLFKILLENTGIIPYSIKCICKMIYILLKKKFPTIKRLHLNAFMSRFFFDKLLLPFLENPIFGALINEYIISPETVKNIKIISDIISRICTGKLYNQEEKNGNYNPFNKYLIEKAIDVFNFYQNIEEVILPEFISKNKDIKEIINSEPFIQRSICFKIEELYALIFNISQNKEKLFVDESTNSIKLLFSKIDRNNHMKILEEIMNENVNKNNSKKKNSKEIKKREIEKYFFITQLKLNEEFKIIFNVERGKPQFQIKELKHPETKQDLEENNIIKVKNIICTILYYLREINVKDFNNISTSLSDTSHIFKEIKNFIKTSYFRINDSIPFNWYVTSLFQCMGKLPQNYTENDYELLYKELKEDIIKSINSFDISTLSNISDKLKYGKRKKNFYEKIEKRLVDITMNEKVQYFLDKLRVPCELYFCYNEKEKKINVKEIKKDDNTLKFLDAMIFVEQSRYVKTCTFIKDFTKYFPNIVKSSIFQGENEEIFKMLKDLEIPKAINKYINIVKNKLSDLKIDGNKEELNDINNKIYDFIMEKIYDKIFPIFQSDNDIRLHDLCIKLSWTEPKNFIVGKKDYIFDTFLPDVIFNFLKMEEEKSPRKKIEYMRAIFMCICQVQNFNGENGGKAGVDDIINILAYAFVKAQLSMANSNFEYLKFFVKPNSQEDQDLQQLNVCKEFILNITHDKLQVSKEEFNENCKKSFDEYLG